MSCGFRIPEFEFFTHHLMYHRRKIILTSSGATVNAFSNNFVMFDDTNNTFDEDVAGSRMLHLLFSINIIRTRQFDSIHRQSLITVKKTL